ncbi:MAG: hypothetical protein EON59_06230 [Alphaproteobacteria bacterium]|nr:MAG: hypothetical protein EON59_06230 [Alphaproteobacteria bacterium]
MDDDTPRPDPAYAVFVGELNPENSRRITNAVCSVMNAGCTHFHLMFQTMGGSVSDGVFLYNFFRTIQMPLTLYNVGSVCSAGAVAFLGAPVRKASAYASFMIHRCSSNLQGASAIGLQGVTDSLTLDDARTEAIIRQHLRLPDEKWALHRHSALWLGAGDALAAGMIDEVAELELPPETMIYSV